MDISAEIKLVENKLFNLFLSDNEVKERLNSFLKGSSKRIRSQLCVFYLKSNNSQIDENIINLLTATELIHNASLLHDDVIDEAEFRRGEKTFANDFNPKISILSGDYLLSYAVKILLEINNSEILNLFINCTEKMADAEIKQYLLREKIPTENEYISICEGKTGALFETMLKSAAILSKTDKIDAENYGKIFGILFQISNDLDYKSKENDMKNGIHTAIDIMGIEKTNSLKDNYKEDLRAISDKFQNKEYCLYLNDLADNL